MVQVPETTPERLDKLAQSAESLLCHLREGDRTDIDWWIALDEYHKQVIEWAPNPQVEGEDKWFTGED